MKPQLILNTVNVHSFIGYYFEIKTFTFVLSVSVWETSSDETFWIKLSLLSVMIAPIVSNGYWTVEDGYVSTQKITSNAWRTNQHSLDLGKFRRVVSRCWCCTSVALTFITRSVLFFMGRALPDRSTLSHAKALGNVVLDATSEWQFSRWRHRMCYWDIFVYLRKQRIEVQVLGRVCRRSIIALRLWGNIN